jgi:hypothetical protein
MIDTTKKTIEPFGKLWRFEAREESAEVPVRKLICLYSGGRRLS